MAYKYAVYMMMNQRGNVLYIGLTRNLIRRVWEHKNGLVAGFTKKYQCHTLVYFEMHREWEHAVARERQIKKWRRAWKENLIRTINPCKRDLYPDIIQ